MLETVPQPQDSRHVLITSSPCSRLSNRQNHHCRGASPHLLFSSGNGLSKMATESTKQKKNTARTECAGTPPRGFSHMRVGTWCSCCQQLCSSVRPPPSLTFCTVWKVMLRVPLHSDGWEEHNAHRNQTHKRSALSVPSD